MAGQYNRQQDNPLGSAPLIPLIAAYAIPSVISMLVGAAYNITDQIFIGHVVGMLGNAATNVAFPTVTLTTGISMLFGIGTAANFSINLGAGDEEEARRYVHNGLTGVAIAGIITGILVFLFRNSIVVLCGADAGGNVFPYAVSYLSITACGLPFQMFAHTSSSIIRADGSPRYSMICTVTGAILNIFLDWLFMYPLGMGIEGAAAATVLSQMVSCLIAALYYPKFKAFRLSVRELGISSRHLTGSMEAGIPNFCNHMLMMCTNIVLNNMLSTYGAYWRAFTAAFLIGVIFFFAFQFFPRQIISIFGTGSDLYYEFAEKYLRVFMMLVFFQNIQPVSINYFSATGNHRQGLLVSLSRQGLFLIPLLVILPKFMGINGILAASPISDTLAFIMSVSMVMISFRKFGKTDEKDDSQAG